MELLVDTHVHIYDCYGVAAALDYAIANLEIIASQSGLSNPCYAICLTEKPGCHYFAKICDNSRSILGQEWRVLDVFENYCISVEHLSSRKLLIYAGHQIVTSERLEILCLGTDIEIKDGEPLEIVWRQIRNYGAVPVVPWSFGKWWGQRGTILRMVLELAKPGELCLSDSSLRPRCYPEPRHFRVANERGIAILAGTDPFPSSSQARVIGSYVSLFRSGFNADKPLTSFCSLVGAVEFDGEIVGRRGGLGETLAKLIKQKFK